MKIVSRITIVVALTLTLGIVIGCGSDDGSDSSSSGNENGSGTSDSDSSDGDGGTGDQQSGDETAVPEDVHRRVMRPYASLDLSEQQVDECRRIIDNKAGRYVELQAEREALKTQPETDELTQQIAEIDEKSNEELKQIRIHVKNVFTPEQLEQHRAEARARNN